jgi:tetratricopeptide (TPR) repeat protein
MSPPTICSGDGGSSVSLRSSDSGAATSADADASALVRAALAKLKADDAYAAEMLCREALSLHRDHTGALGVLGMVLYGAGRTGEACEIFERLCQLEPDERLHWMNLGTTRRGLRQYDGALRAFMRAADLGEGSADFFYNVGLTHLDRRDYEAAREVLKRAVSLAPEDIAIRFEYAKACYESHHLDAALAALEGWENAKGLDASVVAGIGQRLMNLGDTKGLAHATRQLAQLPELDARASLTLAQICERTNRIDEAQAIVDQLLRMPHAASLGSELTSTRASLAQRRGDHVTAVDLFQQSLAARPDPADRHFELFALAKSLDVLGRYDEAFATMTEAHRAQLAHLRQSAPLACLRGTPSMDIARYRCDPEDVAAWIHQPGPLTHESPIFIVAFPRSGTTLVEMMLDAHPDLVSMDEQPIVQAALDDLLATGHRYPEELGKVREDQLQAIRTRYWERVRGKVTLAQGQRLVDKNPLNLLRLPVIRRVFPNARIVLAVRHPCDVLLSCFMQHFRAPEFALLCRDLRALAQGFVRAFDFWYSQVELLRPAVHELRYETLVTALESEARRLLEFVAVPWHDAVLSPAARALEKGYISTPSYSQVVQPVNASAVGRWHAYERHLRPIIPLVAPYLQKWAYEGTEGP